MCKKILCQILLLVIYPLYAIAEKDPEVSLRWVLKNDTKHIQASLTGGEDIIETCVNNGLELRLKYEIKVCVRRVGWFNKCEEPVLATRTLDYDPIGERYRAKQDIRGDKKDPEESTISSQETAISFVRIANKIPMNILVDNQRADYLRARVLGECRGSGTRTLERLSSFLSFGIITTPGFETNWTNFEIDGIN